MDVAANNGKAMREAAAASIESEFHIREGEVRVERQVLSESRGSSLERGERPCREQEQVSRPGRSGGSRSGSFFEDEVSVSAADAEGTDACSSWRRRLPLTQRRVDEERGAGKIDSGIRALEMK